MSLLFLLTLIIKSLKNIFKLFISIKDSKLIQTLENKNKQNQI